MYRRYLAVDPSITERYASLLLSPTNPSPRPLEAAKLLLSLARRAAKGDYASPEGKSPYQLLGDWIEVIEKYPEEVGISLEETITNAAKRAQNTSNSESNEAVASTNGSLIRLAGPAVPVGKDGKELPPYDEDVDPRSIRKLDIEDIIQQDGLDIYKDQAGRLWTGLATYWVKRGEFDRAKVTFEHGIASVYTIRDFTQIFDAYAEFSESLISALMEALADPDEEDEEDAKETEAELDERMKAFEELMDRRPFLVNDVLLRRNPNDVQEWEKRIALWGQDDEKVAETYTNALSTISPRKATPNFHRLFINFAKFYEEGGTTGEAENDLSSARKILEKGTKTNFKTVEDLAEVWCEWAEMELRHECVNLCYIHNRDLIGLNSYSNFDEAIRVMQRAASIPKNSKINYHDHVCI